MKKKFTEYVPALYSVKITYKDGETDTFMNCDHDFMQSLAIKIFEVCCGIISDGFVFVEYSGEVTAIDVEQISGVSVYDEKRKKFMGLSCFAHTNMPTPFKMTMLEI